MILFSLYYSLHSNVDNGNEPQCVCNFLKNIHPLLTILIPLELSHTHQVVLFYLLLLFYFTDNAAHSSYVEDVVTGPFVYFYHLTLPNKPINYLYIF